MDFEFKTKEELYQHVLPALKSKRRELVRLGFSYIQEEDIWNYFIKEKWSQAKDLQLSDIVSDIMHADGRVLERFVRDNLSRVKRNQNKNLEVI